MSDEPLYLFVAQFWRCILLDLTGKGVTSDEVPIQYRSQTYPKRVMIEREILRQEALEFLNTPAFDVWADVSGFNANEMREKLCQLSMI